MKSLNAIGHSDDLMVKLDCFYGHVEMQTRMRPEGRKLIGEGRSRTYDGEGRLVNDTGWQPTGCALTWPDEEECKPWWRFW